MAKFRLSDLWWDDRSIGGRIALYFASRRNARLHGRRSYTRRPVTYDRVVKASSDGAWTVIKTVVKVAIGLFAALAIIGFVSLVYFFST